MRNVNVAAATPSTPQHYSTTAAAAAAAFSAFDPALLSAAHQVCKFYTNERYSIFTDLFFHFQYAAAISGTGVGAGLFSLSQYPLNLAALAVAHNKNSSIADLRLKAKKHAEALGLKENSS